MPAQGNYEIQVYGTERLTRMGDQLRIGVGPTAATDHLIIKGILGRGFYWGKPSPAN